MDFLQQQSELQLDSFFLVNGDFSFRCNGSIVKVGAVYLFVRFREGLFSVIASIPIPCELREGWKLDSANFRLLAGSERCYRGNLSPHSPFLGIAVGSKLVPFVPELSIFSVVAPQLSGNVHFPRHGLIIDIESSEFRGRGKYDMQRLLYCESLGGV